MRPRADMRFIPALFLFCALAAPRSRPVWIDTDPSVAPGGHELDDGIALLQAFGSPEIAIRGVSIVFGNADLPTADRIGRYIVKEFGPRGLRVYTGAVGAVDLGRETDASRALSSALRRERLTILVLGPATNVATVLKLHPELASRIHEIVSVAGRRPGQQFTLGTATARPLRDLNFEMNPEAFQVLLDSKVKLAFAPWEVSSKVLLTREDLEPLASKSAGMAWLLPSILDWLQVWKTQFGTNGFNPFDAVAVGYLVDPGTIDCAAMSMRIETSDKPYLVVRESKDGRAVTYCHTPSPRFKERLLYRLQSAPP
jgi:inosine-uridine nucleoside N-ribohydrolase